MEIFIVCCKLCLKNASVSSIYQSFLPIDLLAIQQQRLDRALFLYIFIHEIRLSGVRASITIAYSKILQNMAKYRSIEILLKNSYSKRSIQGCFLRL